MVKSFWSREERDKGELAVKEFYRSSQSKGNSIGAALTLEDLDVNEKATLRAFETVINASVGKSARVVSKKEEGVADITMIGAVYTKLADSNTWLSQYGVDAEIDNSANANRGASASASPFARDLTRVQELATSKDFLLYATKVLDNSQSLAA